jgi:hypothetical protein
VQKLFLFFISLLISITIFFTVKANSSELIHINCTYQNDKREFVLDTIEGDEYKAIGNIYDMNTTIYIKNTSNLSETEDYILYEKGDKKVLFSLKCKKQ